MAGKARLIALAVLAMAIGSCTDVTVPTQDPPTNVTVTMVTATSARVSWTPPAFPDLVINYNVFRDGTKIGESATTFFVDAGLVQGVTYKYRVSASGVQGVESEQSAESPAATITVPDVTPPSVTSTSPFGRRNRRVPGGNCHGDIQRADQPVDDRRKQLLGYTEAALRSPER